MRYLFTYFFTCIIIFFANQSFALDITFKKEAQVADNFVVLGDIADFSETSPLTEALTEVVVAQAPKPGSNSQIVGQTVIRDILRKNPLPRSTRWFGSATISVHRAGMEITASDIFKEIDTYLASKKELFPEAELIFTASKKPLPFFLPKGKIDWEIRPSDPDIIGSSHFSVIIKVDNRVRKNLRVTGNIKAITRIVVAKNDLQRGTIITPEMITMTTTDISRMSQPFFSMRDVIGKKLKRSIYQDTAIEKSLVEYPPVIVKNQLVKIVVQKGSLFVSASGVARMNGKMNEIIRVQNISSRKLIFCKVAAPGIVEVVI